MLSPQYKTFTYKNKTLNLRDWSKITGISYHTLYYRVNKGYSLEEVFGDKTIMRGTPVRKTNK